MLIATLLLLGVVAAEGPVLQARFIGNSAFEISDGTTTILTDFPYQSGAFGYMTLPEAELREHPGALCLFSHRHADHFDPKAVAAIGCTVAGPDDVQAAVSESLRAGKGPVWQVGGAEIRCVPTEHASVEHCSYFIRWHGLEIFFSGDIESLDVVSRSAPPLDVVFVSSWLIPTIDRLGPAATNAKVIVHHHKADEKLPPCSRCVVPAQGSTIELTAAPSPTRE